MIRDGATTKQNDFKNKIGPISISCEEKAPEIYLCYMMTDSLQRFKYFTKQNIQESDIINSRGLDLNKDEC